VRTLKIILTVLILAVALFTATIALFWEQLLTPEQKMGYGLHFSAEEEYAHRARAHPDNAEILADYADALVITGNLGRATYLHDLYGVENEQLEQLRAAVEKSIIAASNDQVYELHNDPAVQAVADLPVREVFRYLEGYQHALLGDWASALNYFAAIEEKRLAPRLRPYYRYYLARCYRLAGSAEEKSKIEDMLLGIIANHQDTPLAAKARYNLIAWYLSADYPGIDPVRPANNQLVGLATAGDSWAMQKGYCEFADYCLGQEDYVLAWNLAVAALQKDPLSLPGKQASEQVALVLRALLESKASWGMSESGAIILALPEHVFIDLALAGAKHGSASQTAELLNELKPHVVEADRDRWEELRVGMAICHEAERNTTAMRQLMADANLRNLSEASLGEIYYRHAQLLEQDQQWNTAIEYYRSSAVLNGPHGGEAVYRCYAILKRVQDPLNLDRAVEYMQTVVEDYPTCEAMPKAVEELLPLLIFRGDTTAATYLINWVLDLEPSTEATAVQARMFEQLQEVARFWRAYMFSANGREDDAADERWLIPLKYWNYYEITSNYPPQPGLSQVPEVLQLEECAGEFFAGMGLTDTARQYYEASDPESQLFAYLSLANGALTRPLGSRQWYATEHLESGVCREQPLLEFALGEAFPRPYTNEVQAAASEFNVSPDLIWAVMKKESSFREDAVSGSGALGLMQLMPGTASWVDSKYNMGLKDKDTLDPAVNVRLGTAYLASLYEIFGQGQTRAVIHAYNRGDGNYRKWRERYGTDQVLLTELVPSEENEVFGKKVTRYFKIYEWLAGH
jgi:soluble lytic murein transglycosylase-like protein